jgi:hypothetical protein
VYLDVGGFVSFLLDILSLSCASCVCSVALALTRKSSVPFLAKILDFIGSIFFWKNFVQTYFQPEKDFWPLLCGPFSPNFKRYFHVYLKCSFSGLKKNKSKQKYSTPDSTALASPSCQTYRSCFLMARFFINSNASFCVYFAKLSGSDYGESFSVLCNYWKCVFIKFNTSEGGLVSISKSWVIVDQA